MPFGLTTRMDPWNHALDGSRYPMGRSNFEGEGLAHCKVQRHSAVSFAKMAELIKMQFALWARMGPRNHVLDGGPDPDGKGQF